MKNYREFVDQVSEKLADILPDKLKGADITAHQVDKLQGASYYGITVRPEDSMIGVSMNLKEAYGRLQEGESFDQVLKHIAEETEKGIENSPGISLNEISNYDAMKDKLMIQVVPTAENEGMLATVPHVEKEDMSIVYRFVFSTDSQGMASALVTNQMLETFGITAEQLHADALANAQERFPANVRSMQEVLADMMGIEPEMMPGDEGGMYVATCNNGMNGAGCIFYPEFMKQAAEKLEGDFFILPSSTHEVILLPDNGSMNYKELEGMVQEINSSEVAPQDRLSDSVYHYDSREHVFEKAEVFESHKQEKEAAKKHDRGNDKPSLMGKLDAKKKEAAALDSGRRTPHIAKNAEL